MNGVSQQLITIGLIYILGAMMTVENPSAHAKSTSLSDGPKQVLITGFYDWKDLGDPPQLIRCRDNPSCRLLAGEGIGARQLNGPLAQRLKRLERDSQRKLSFTFALLPVTWGSVQELPVKEYDVVIHLGLGVYDSFHQIKVEYGAYNHRKGVDAAGQQKDERMTEDDPIIYPPSPKIKKGVKLLLDAKLPGPFQAILAEAREENVYLCNETYFSSLSSITSSSKLQEAYFLHLPHREGDNDQALADAVSALVRSVTF